MSSLEQSVGDGSDLDRNLCFLTSSQLFPFHDMPLLAEVTHRIPLTALWEAGSVSLGYLVNRNIKDNKERKWIV